MSNYVWHNDGFFLGYNVDGDCIGGIGLQTGVAYVDGKYCKPPTKRECWNREYKFTHSGQSLSDSQIDELKAWVEGKHKGTES